MAALCCFRVCCLMVDVVSIHLCLLNDVLWSGPFCWVTSIMMCLPDTSCPRFPKVQPLSQCESH